MSKSHVQLELENLIVSEFENLIVSTPYDGAETYD